MNCAVPCTPDSRKAEALQLLPVATHLALCGVWHPRRCHTPSSAGNPAPCARHRYPAVEVATVEQNVEPYTSKTSSAVQQPQLCQSLVHHDPHDS